MEKCQETAQVAPPAGADRLDKEDCLDKGAGRGAGAGAQRGSGDSDTPTNTTPAPAL